MGLFNSLLDGGILGLAGDVVGGLFGSHSASEANSTNIKNQREQRAWEENMSNTAVQRRADDIEKAGGNRALAFTNGVSASTPSISAPTVEPTFRPEWTKGSVAQSQLLAEQLRQMRINNLKTAQDAALTQQEARIRKVEADAKERYGADMADWDYQRSELSVTEAKERINKLLTENASTAAQTEKMRGLTDKLIRMAEAQAREKEINLEALENWAKVGGVQGEKVGPLMRYLLDTIITLTRGK